MEKKYKQDVLATISKRFVTFKEVTLENFAKEGNISLVCFTDGLIL